MSHSLKRSLLVLSLLINQSMAMELYLSPTGSDSHPGTSSEPLQSLQAAQRILRDSGSLGKEPVTVHLASGTYFLQSPLLLTAVDSGAADAPLRIVAEEEGQAVLSGGVKLDLEWKPYRDGMFQATVSGDHEIDQLFVNGKRQHMARYPNYNPNEAIFHGYDPDAFSPERVATWNDPAGGYIHAQHDKHWGGLSYRITGKNADNTLEYEGGWQNNRPQHGMDEKRRFVENIFEELDAPGEWYFATDTRMLYYYPAPGMDLTTATVVSARLPKLVEFRGTAEEPVQHIELQGLTFRHTARTFMETREPLLRSDWTIYRCGAVLLTGAEDVEIADCVFDQVGGNAVFVSAYNRRVAIRGVHVNKAGASAVAFVGSPDAVRNPLMQYEEELSYAEIDKTPGPKSEDYPADCLVEDSLLHEIGVVEKQSAGVQISMAKRITVRHCSIYDTSRAGINISEGTFGGHLIEHCDVFDTVTETGDHGSFNSWGRDRFWHLNDAPEEKLAELSKLDTEKTIIRNSRWRCDHGWDIDLDDGSSHYEIYNNLMLNGGLKLREGFFRVVYNNITVNSTMFPHVWYKDSEDVVTRNIWMAAYYPAKAVYWGKEIDHNFFTTQRDAQEFNIRGADRNSLWGDPMFVDPAKGDFRVKEGSPALKTGFKNFPMDRFGVQKPGLKAIARVPKFPVPDLGGTGSVMPRRVLSTTEWKGGTLRQLSGMDFSAFGVTKEKGGIHLMTVPAGGELETMGFRQGDLIQEINGKRTRSIKYFNRELEKTKAKSRTYTVVRDQNTFKLTVEPELP